MIIKHELPPNYAALCAAFPAIVNNPDVIFAYGDFIYNPSGRFMPPEKIAHEEVHGEQQREVGVEWWWDMYIKDKDFRLQEEIPAHHADYKEYCRQVKGREMHFQYLTHLATSLSSELYGNVIGLAGAKVVIRYGKKV